MSNNKPDNGVICAMNEFQQKLSLELTREFPKQILGTIPKGDKDLLHVPHQYVIRRFNEVLGPFYWSFRVLGHSIHEKPSGRWEVTVPGSLTINLPEEPGSFNVMSVTKEQIGTKDIQYPRSDKKDWDRNFSEENPTQIGDDIKSAASLALVKCASLVGVGSELYFPEEDLIDHATRLKLDMIEEIKIMAKGLSFDKEKLTELFKSSLGLKGNVESLGGFRDYQYAIVYAELLRLVHEGE